MSLFEATILVKKMQALKAANIPMEFINGELLVKDIRNDGSSLWLNATPWALVGLVKRIKSL